ncbi:MAG: LEA type 2 family protein [Bacteroidales bacterium]|nr:LEA type 2 family protein [Bacteroidales bacterium]
MKKTIVLGITAIVIVALASCSVVNDLADQVKSVANLRNCEFSLKKVSGVAVAGVDVKSLTQGRLSAGDVIKLVAAYKSGKVPLEMDVNVGVKNPTSQKASMTAMDWILAIDGKDVAGGASRRSHTIKAKSTTTVPLPVNTDLGKLFSKEGVESLKKFASSFSSEGTSSKVGLRVKPSLSVGSTQVPFPNYIKLEKKTGKI